MGAEQTIFDFAGQKLDLAKGRLHGPGGEVALPPKSFDLLVYLLQNAGRVIPKDELLDAIWPDVTVTEDSLPQCIRDIRLALAESGAGLLRTVPRRGYLFADAAGQNGRPKRQSSQPNRLGWRHCVSSKLFAPVRGNRSRHISSFGSNARADGSRRSEDFHLNFGLHSGLPACPQRCSRTIETTSGSQR